MRHIVALVAVASLAWAGPATTHTNSIKTKHFEVRYRPESRAGASAPRAAVMAERDLARICRLLDIPVAGAFKLFLYDSVEELAAITKTAGNAGFSAGNETHIPYDNDQTRFHELVHVVAYRLPKAGAEPRSLFFAEGLANALLEHVHGVHVHAVATYYRKRAKLPPLGDMAGARDFYAWLRARPGFNAYDVAASWFRFLIDHYPVAKVRAYYTGVAADKAFGDSLGKLEDKWHDVLDAYKMTPEVEMLLRKRNGEAVSFKTLGPLPARLLGKPADWKNLTAKKLPADWTRKEATLAGVAKTANWSICALGKRRYKNVVLRAKIRPANGCLGVQIQLGNDVQVMLVQNGLFVYEGGKPRHWNNSEKLAGTGTLDLVLARKNGELEVWLDGVQALKGKVKKDAAIPGIGVALGPATFTDVKIRVLR